MIDALIDTAAGLLVSEAIKVLKLLWAEDSYKLFYKGLTARLSYSCFYSFLIILGYETVKKLSLKDEYIWTLDCKKMWIKILKIKNK